MRAIVMAVLAAGVLLGPAAGRSAQPAGPNAAPAPAPAATASRAPAPAGRMTDLNTANLDELTAVPGIGERLAQSILDLRAKKGSFAGVEELLEVRGIGEKSIKSLAAYLTVLPGKPGSAEPTPIAQGK